jgi:hypothetical protein
MMQNGNGAQIAESPPGATEAALAAATTLTRYYSDRKLMWRNVLWITFGHFGSSLSQTILEPLMNLRLKSIGVSQSSVGLIVSLNLWAVSFLVMYVSWKSDHCTSRLGRRTPFTLLSLPFILLALVLFPLFTQKWLLMGLMLIYFFFNDVKGFELSAPRNRLRLEGRPRSSLRPGGHHDQRGRIPLHTTGREDGGHSPGTCVFHRRHRHDEHDASRSLADHGTANPSPGET